MNEKSVNHCAHSASSLRSSSSFLLFAPPPDAPAATGTRVALALAGTGAGMSCVGASGSGPTDEGTLTLMSWESSSDCASSSSSLFSSFSSMSCPKPYNTQMYNLLWQSHLTYSGACVHIKRVRVQTKAILSEIVTLFSKWRQASKLIT